MDEVIKLSTIEQYNALTGVQPLHSLITVIDLAKAKPMPPITYNSGIYGIYLANTECGELKYGRNYYHYQEGSLAFTAPGQVMTIRHNPESAKGAGIALLFHPDLIKRSPLGKQIKEYTFFLYEVNEALNISDEEKYLVLNFFSSIESELQKTQDRYSDEIITSNIDLLLKHCQRFFNRQFLIDGPIKKGILEKFENLLNEYFASDLPQKAGIPTVAYFADQLHLTANYFGGLIKKETGCSALEYIQSKIIDIAKERILNPDKSIAEIADELGYKYPQHFSRLFKQKAGYSPHDYRQSRWS